MRIASLFAALALAAGPALGAPALRKVAEVELPGPPGERFDYLRVDPAGGRIFVTHLGAGQVYVVSLKDQKVLATIPGTPGVEDVAYVPEMNRLYSSNWGENKIGVIDLATMKVIERIPTGNKPDGMEYAAPFGKVYVSNERANAETAIDVRTGKTTEIKFDSETGVPRYDPVARKLYVNLQDRSELAVIDPATDKLVERIRLPGCRGNHGMALDPERHRVFLACAGGNNVAVLDLDKKQVVASVDIPRGVDFIEFDPGLRRLYAACISGAIAVIQQGDGDRYTALEELRLESVHTVAVDPTTHRVYATLEREGGKPVAKLVVFEPAN